LIFPHFLGGVLNRIYDVLVSGTSAEVPLQAVTDLRIGWIRVAGEELQGYQEHPGRAEAALQPMFLPEPLLNRVQIAIACQTFNGEQLRAIGLHG